MSRWITSYRRAEGGGKETASQGPQHGALLDRRDSYSGRFKQIALEPLTPNAETNSQP